MYSKKWFGKYFLMFGCVAENNMENTFSYCFLHFLTFSQLPNKNIVQFFNRLTQILLNSSKPNQKKINQTRSNSSKSNYFSIANSVQSVPAKSKSNGDPGLWVRRRSQWVRFEVEALGSWCDSKSKLWVCGAKSLGLR